MKRWGFLGLILSLFPLLGGGQALSNIPPPMAMFYSSDGTGNLGTWTPASGSGSGAISNIPPAIAMYCSNNGTGAAGTWVPCGNIATSGASSQGVTVTAYGADPSGVADSTAAFNSAIAALPNGGRLWIPCGTYRVNPTSSFKPVSGTIIQGSGPYCTTVLYSGSTSTPVWLANNYVNGTGGQGQFLKFQDFTMSGNSVAGSVCFSVGTPNLSTAKVQNVTFENMRVTACNSGLTVNDVWDLNLIASDFAFNIGDAIDITDPDAVTGMYLFGTRVHNNTVRNIYNSGAGTVTQFEMYGGEATYSGNTEIVLGNCRDCDLYGVWLEEAGAGTTQNGVDVTNAIQVRMDNIHANFINNVVISTAAVSYISISNSSSTNGQANFVNVTSGSTHIDFGQNNRSNVSSTTGTAAAQNFIDCPNATTASLTTGVGLAVNACSGFDIQRWFANGAVEAFISNVGNVSAKGMLSMSGSTYTSFQTGTSGAGASITRNVSDAFPVEIFNNANATSTGDIVDYQNQGTNQVGLTVQGIEFHRVGTAVTAAATIAPTSPSFHITGTTQITTITPPTTCTTAAESGCILYAIPDALGSLGTGGNIIKASTFVVGQLMILIYDQAQAKWYPSY